MGQIGSLKLETSSGTVEVPVYATGDSGSSVYENLRVKTGNGTGFIPLADTSEATYSYLRLNTSNYGTLAFHDSATIVYTVDDFEDNDLSEYGRANDSTIVTSPVSSGSYALRIQPASNDSWAVSTSGLSNYPSQGDTFRCYHRTDTSDTNFGFAWGAQNTASSGTRPDCYWIQLRPNEDTIYFIKTYSGGSTTQLNSASATLATGTWYDVETVWNTDGTMTVTVYDTNGNSQGSVSATDTAFTSGGIGFYTNEDTGSPNHYFDYYRIV